MTKTLILIVILITLYLYWKRQSKTISPKSDKEEVFFDAEDWESDNNSNHD
ncbi:hypothetical protein [endosymbiont GvMRE of Glomus versiforme]|uniref:hypothetical protein n=1 Tax=endosymbiont GvMRE of Glomus versiforme TaxID=2039283 RepID=UPI000ED1147B|nr:hypothetical protein [endosymbiont GvMRE of Glomus versiforme]RHZ35560.1 hypothetical protein GvMRE_IIg17 [endosymbiont GvMRE of Glomus versiforme]